VQRDQLIKLLEPTVEGLGYELADLEVTPDILRLFIDNPDKGVVLEDCEIVSRQISALLDVEDPLPGEYSLEVSTPGMNRRLVKPEHFERFTGSKIKVKTKGLIEGRRNFKGMLVGCDATNVQLKENKTEFLIPLREIDTARVVPDY
jgi:ribosome maturation factor RimP